MGIDEELTGQGNGYINFQYFWRIINSLKNQIANISGGGGSGVTGIIASPPDNTFDTAHGYKFKDLLYDSNTGFLWVCLDPTDNAAVWQSVVGNQNP